MAEDEIHARLRLELDSMKVQMMNHVVLHMGDVPLKLAIEQAVGSFDWTRAIERGIHEAITMSVQNFFRHGEGYAFVESAARGGLTERFDKINEALKESIETPAQKDPEDD